MFKGLIELANIIGFKASLISLPIYFGERFLLPLLTIGDISSALYFLLEKFFEVLLKSVTNLN